MHGLDVSHSPSLFHKDESGSKRPATYYVIHRLKLNTTCRSSRRYRFLHPGFIYLVQCPKGVFRMAHNPASSVYPRLHSKQCKLCDVPEVVPADITELRHPRLKHLWPVDLSDKFMLLRPRIRFFRNEEFAHFCRDVNRMPIGTHAGHVIRVEAD